LTTENAALGFQKLRENQEANDNVCYKHDPKAPWDIAISSDRNHCNTDPKQVQPAYRGNGTMSEASLS
jgi:hypothetical protein